MKIYLVSCLSSPPGLHLPPTYISGEIPKEIGQLTRLTSLRLGSCGLVGENTSCRDLSTKIRGQHFLRAWQPEQMEVPFFAVR